MGASPRIIAGLLGASLLGFALGRVSSGSSATASAIDAGASASAASPAVDARAPALLPVPIVRQSTEYTCGAAAVTAVLAYWRAGTDLREADLGRLMHTND